MPIDFADVEGGELAVSVDRAAAEGGGGILVAEEATNALHEELRAGVHDRHRRRASFSRGLRNLIDFINFNEDLNLSRQLLSGVLLINQIWITVSDEAYDIHNVIHMLEHVHWDKLKDLEPLETGNVPLHVYPYTCALISSLILGPRELPICVPERINNFRHSWYVNFLMSMNAY